jgi:hypothetical protein
MEGSSGSSGGGGGGGGGTSSGGGFEGPPQDVDRSPLWYQLFLQYTALVEERLEAALSHMDPPCDGAELEAVMTLHAEELGGEVFDLLMSLNNYEEFEQTMISYAWEGASGGGGGGGAQLAPTVTRFIGAEGEGV